MALDEETQRRIAGEEGMSLEQYRRTKDQHDQFQSKSTHVQHVGAFLSGSSPYAEWEKMKRVTEKMEVANKKKEEKEAGADKWIRWIYVVDAIHAVHRAVEIEVDPGSNANFVTMGMAQDLRLQVQSLSPSSRGDSMNGDIVCHEYAEVYWLGKESQANTITFYILPADDPPNHPRIIKPVVGDPFWQDFKHLLLEEDPRNPAWSTKMGKETAFMKEQREKEAAKVEEYQASSAREREAYRQNKDSKAKNQQGKGSSSQDQGKRGS